ncbi:hypothetical protein VNO77_41912 [Canavalia gladiata]|uniref:Uncharacterized protein n=1 Tax=Canavalia gladiata TaxID=3824 RepID=A0AAN9JZQ7_CANGL
MNLFRSLVEKREHDVDVDVHVDKEMNNQGLRLEVVFRTLIDRYANANANASLVVVSYAALLSPLLSCGLSCFRDGWYLRQPGSTL